MFLITTSTTLIYVYFAFTRDIAIHKFWLWIIIPISVTAMSISFVLKPRRNDGRYNFFLYFQYFIFAYISTFLSLVGRKFTPEAIISTILYCILWYLIFIFAYKSREYVASHDSDKELSYFLTNDVMVGGVIIGLGQLAFLAFPSIQCGKRNADGDWRQCNRTLYSQAGLSTMVALYVVIKLLVRGFVPERILEKHTISHKKIVAMKMNVEEFVQALGFFVAIGCALRMLGNYGAEGDFRNYSEQVVAFVVPCLGNTCVFLTAVWEWIAIRREIKWERQSTLTTSNTPPFTRTQTSMSPSADPESPLTEASSLWFYLGLFTTTFQSMVLRC
ncbi:hypothetical protein TrLO_g3271 [Triparma laevis f. longispina]|uniref:Uncharacterized protein n=1 Tax=Triparma laevis f. longispina TaxID=1714387 RepID=A0A9W7FSZ3_9STRA|nr:hypothetical protein TrLO_g3271 [Triparma laevis f. longispina]